MAILLFHRVTDLVPEDGLTVSPSHFRAICRMLRREFHVVSLAEVFRLVRAGKRPPPRTVAITFDDSYRDNLDAARVLAEHGLPATFFLPTAYLGTERVYDWDRHLPVRLPNLTWDDAAEMATLGFDIGSHSVTHPNMATLSDEDARRELVESKKQLELRLGRPVRWFAYPFGDPEHFRPEQLALVYEAGYEGCVSAHHGFIDHGGDYAILPREPAVMFGNVLSLEMHLRGCLRWFYEAKKSARTLFWA